MSLHFSFFGEPLITKDGEAVSLPFKKAEALLFFLAAEGCAPKEKITFLLWGDKNEKQAAGSLRNALCLLRRNFPDNIVANKKDIRLADFTRDADVVDKIASRTEPLPEEIFSEPLSGFDMLDRPEFAEWLGETRAKLREKTVSALRDRITACYDARDMEGAAESLSALLFFEPYEEESVLELMEIYRDEGAPSKAVAAYNSYREKLRADLGIEPSERAKNFLFTIGKPPKRRRRPGDFLRARGRDKEDFRAGAEAAAGWTVIFIHGEGGVGKTALVEQALRSAFGGADVFRASPLSVGEKFPYSSLDGTASAMGALCAERARGAAASRARDTLLSLLRLHGRTYACKRAVLPERTPPLRRTRACLARQRVMRQRQAGIHLRRPALVRRQIARHPARLHVGAEDARRDIPDGPPGERRRG